MGASGGIVAHAWHGTPDVVPFVLANMNQSWIDQAEGATRLLNARPPGRRAMLLGYDHPGLWGPVGTPLRTVIVDGPFRVEEHRAWLRGLFGVAARAGVTPDFVALDNESMPTLWAHADPVAAMRELLADPKARQKLPDEVFKYAAEDYAWARPKMRDAYNTFHRATAAMHVAALRGVAEEARRAFGRAVPVVNWLDHASDRPALDVNGWPIPKATVSGWSAPALYVNADGQFVAGMKRRPRWNKLILALNNLRAAAAGGGPVTPWVSHPSYNGDAADAARVGPWLWVELQKHIAATGVRTVLYWNPQGPKVPTDDAMAARTWAAATP